MLTYRDKQYPSKSILKQGCGPIPKYNHTGNIVVNIRGTNGTGKTYTANLVMNNYQLERRFKHETGVTILDYGKFYVLGSYDTDCGGLDIVKDFYTIHPIVMELIKEKHMLIEGLLWSSVYSAAHKLEQALVQEGHSYIWFGIDGKVEEFINRVISRRASRGEFDPYPLQNLLMKVPPVSHGLNHSILFGSRVFIGTAEQDSQAIIKLFETGDPDCIQYRKEFYFHEDFEKWNKMLDEDENIKLECPPELKEKALKEKQEQAFSLFSQFS